MLPILGRNKLMMIMMMMMMMIIIIIIRKQHTMRKDNLFSDSKRFQTANHLIR